MQEVKEDNDIEVSWWRIGNGPKVYYILDYRDEEFDQWPQTFDDVWSDRSITSLVLLFMKIIATNKKEYLPAIWNRN